MYKEMNHCLLFPQLKTNVHCPSLPIVVTIYTAVTERSAVVAVAADAVSLKHGLFQPVSSSSK